MATVFSCGAGSIGMGKPEPAGKNRAGTLGKNGRETLVASLVRFVRLQGIGASIQFVFYRKPDHAIAVSADGAFVQAWKTAGWLTNRKLTVFILFIRWHY